jgi:flagellar assembly factor FliW
MKIESERFGTMELDAGELIEFPAGIVGFPNERSFVLVSHGQSESVVWLQSAGSPALAFPVVSAHKLAPRYPDVGVEPMSEQAGVGGQIEELAVLVVLSATRGQPATVNLLAPIIVNVATRRGAQVILEGTSFTTRELFLLPRTEAPQATVREESEALASAEAIAE